MNGEEARGKGEPNQEKEQERKKEAKEEKHKHYDGRTNPKIWAWNLQATVS